MVSAVKNVRYLPLRGFELPFKSFNNFLNLFSPQIKLKYSRDHSTGRNTDILDTVQMQKYLNFLANEDSQIHYKSNEQVVQLLKNKMSIEEEIKILEKMSSEGDKELEKLIVLEKEKYSENIQEIKNNLLDSLISFNDENDSRNVELQIVQGIGGEESKLFSEELFEMYVNYAKYKNWELSGDDGSAFISGDFVYGHLRYEAGVHRVQRVPSTEKSGRTHTSTCSVVVLPQPKPCEIVISNKDLIIEKTTSCGAGGQNVNKRETCVRIKHIPTGISVENQSQRFQYANLNMAMNKLRSILFNMEQEKITKERKLLRKEQAGTNEYSDKIRTYQFIQNRVTDHRINFSTHNIRGFLEGNHELDHMISQVREWSKKRQLLLHVENTLQSEEYKKFEKAQSR